MKLIKIAAENFKGQSFSEPLAAAQLFVGSNFSGKTARTDAIRLALMGYLPELGKTNKDTFALSSSTTMAVEATFEDGSILARRWTLKGDSIKSESAIPPAFEKSERFEVMMDASKYFGLSDRARIEYVFGLVNLGQIWTVHGVETRLTNKATDKDAAAAIIAEFPQTATVQAMVESAIEVCSVSFKQAKANAVRFEQTIQGMTHLRAGDEPGAIMSKLEADQAAVAEQITAITVKRADLLTGYTAIRSARIRRAEIDREKSAGEKSTIELASWKAKQDQIAAERTAIFPPSDIVGDDILLNIATLSARMTTEANELRKMRADMDAYEKQIDDVDGKKTCPYCGAAGEDWKTIKLAELAGEVEKVQSNYEALVLKTAKTQADLETAKTSQRRFASYKEKLANLDKQEAETLRNIARIEPQLARLTALDEERERLAPEDPELEAKVETLQSELNVKNQDSREIQVKIKACMGRQSELQRLAQAEKARDEARNDEETAKELGKELRVIQAEMVASAFAPLLAKANEFFPGILKGSLEYNSQTGEIGYSGDGLFVSHHTMSGSEKALVYSAMQAALTAENHCKIMIIDELGRFDNLNLGKMLDGVKKGIDSGHISNFIGIDTGRMEFYADCVATVEGADSCFNCRLIQ